MRTNPSSGKKVRLLEMDAPSLRNLDDGPFLQERQPDDNNAYADAMETVANGNGGGHVQGRNGPKLEQLGRRVAHWCHEQPGKGQIRVNGAPLSTVQPE